MDNKSVILPKWIDKIIFDDFEAVYDHALWRWFIIQINHTNL